ncbi:MULTISPECIES: hypothetical protein [Brevundimonas]|uniref:Uncharacterized protein n=1 Tax=Brevundimonas guildfordensis TaxID=2762241 RepID=A0ABR8QWU8_9CAUL|nr:MULTISPECIES: hypothetical protein [Brevundimonas]MBD7940008.1 hypothetical protein [Brevundimonas guildfordensis]
MAAKLDFERWMQGLGVPMGEAMRATGPIMESRLSERGVSWTELDESQVIALFVSAFREDTPAIYPHRDTEALNQALDQMLANIEMETTATAGRSDTIN